jgi:hypothetical protein
MRLITVQDTMYEVCGKASSDTQYGYEQLKQMYRADTVLRNGNTLYLCRVVLEADFTEIEKVSKNTTY